MSVSPIQSPQVQRLPDFQTQRFNVFIHNYNRHGKLSEIVYGVRDVFNQCGDEEKSANNPQPFIQLPGMVLQIGGRQGLDAFSAKQNGITHFFKGWKTSFFESIAIFLKKIWHVITHDPDGPMKGFKKLWQGFRGHSSEPTK